jgi:hypothetical protein
LWYRGSCCGRKSGHSAWQTWVTWLSHPVLAPAERTEDQRADTSNGTFWLDRWFLLIVCLWFAFNCNYDQFFPWIKNAIRKYV